MNEHDGDLVQAVLGLMEAARAIEIQLHRIADMFASTTALVGTEGAAAIRTKAVERK